MKRRILALLLTVLMLVSTFPLTLLTVFAEELGTETALEEGEVVTLYDNEFDTAMNPNGGSSSSCVREDYTNFNDGKGMTIYGSGTWTEPVPLNNNSGEIVITMYFYNNNFVSGTTLSINDVAIFGGDASAIPTIGGATQGTNARAYRLGTLTVTISDLTTGVASVKYVDQYTNTYTGTVTVGTIKDSITLKMGSFVNSFKVDYVTVTQVYAEEEEVSGYTVNFKSNGTVVSSVSTEGSVVAPEAPTSLGYDFMGWSDGENTYTVGAELTVDKDTTFEALWTLSDGVLYGNDFSSTANGADSSGSGASVANGMLVLNGWSNNSWTKNITPNNLKNTITVSFKMQPNLQNSYDILAVNGKVVLKAAANGIVIGDTAYSAVPGYNQSNVVRKVTVTIDPTTNEATVSYNHPTDATHAENYTETVNIGVIVGELAITLGAVSGANSWSVDDLLVTQQALAEHTCNFVRSELYSTAATCNVPAMDVGECTVCGATSSRTVVSPALGHDWTEYTVEDGYQTRSCNTCGHSETKKVGKIINTMPLLALGDSITFGTGVNNNPQNSWAKYVADELGLDYVNIARAGSPLYSWYCVLTGNNAPNGQMYYIGGWDQESLTREIEEASIIVFTLYTNDIFYGEWRPAEDIVECLVDFVGAIHEINPNAIIVPVGYAYGEAFWPGNQYGQYEEKLTTINELCIEAFNTGDYNDYVYYVDCTDIFSDHASFIRDYNSDPDGVHPGTQGNIAMAASVMAALGNTKAGDPDTLYDITFKDGEETVKTDSYYGMYLLPEALTKEGKVFGGWSDGTSVFVANTEVLVLGDTTFTAVWNDPVEDSFNISDIMETVEGAFVSGDLSKSQVYDAETGILTATRSGRYSFSLQKGVAYDGKTTLALTSTNTYTNTGSNNSDTIGVTLPTDRPVLIKNGTYVGLTYYYAPTATKTNVGRTMKLTVTYLTASGTNASFTATSVNTTEANGWETVWFDLGSAANVANIADQTITSIAIRWYDNTFVSTTNDAYYFDSISFTNVSPFNTVKYQENGADVADSVKVLDEVTLPETFKQNGYKLIGWTADGTTTYEPGATVAITADTTFAPVWQKINYYNVTFKDGEETLTDLSGTYEEIFDLPTITKDGYRFDGWNDGTTTYAAGTTVTLTADATYTAVWTKIYNVTVTNDGAVVETRTVTGSYTLPAAPTKDGYTFIGWANGTERYPAKTALTIIGDTEFVAVWISPDEENNYTNLQNTLYKLKNDKKLTIGWITDSIGWGVTGNSSGVVNGVDYGSAFGSGAKNPMSFTRVVSDWLEWYANENYGVDGADVDVFYSTYGGATHQRELGYLREDLLAYLPDIVFIETWNGTDVASDSVYNNRVASVIYLESIVQQIYAINPYCDIVLVNPGGNGAGFGFGAVQAKYDLLEIKVAAQTSAYFSNKDIFGDEAASATIYYGGGIHINEEAYAFYSQLITAALEEQFNTVKSAPLYDTYMPAQADDMRIVTDGEGNVTLPENTIYGTGLLYLTSERLDVDEITYDGNWTLTDGTIDVTAPLDSAEKSEAKTLTATADGATVTFTVNGSGFMVRGSGSRDVTIKDADGNVIKETTNSSEVYIKCSPDDADGTYTVTLTVANKAVIIDILVFGHEYTPIETYENVKDRYVVTYYGKIADEYIHNQQKNGYDILPKYLTWINIKRVELFGADATATIAGNILTATKFEKNGTFVGWVEADSYSYFEGEKFPVVNAYKYEDGKIIDLTTNEEKTLYVEGDVITPARDMTLVAVYSGGYDGDETKHTVQFVSGDETLKTLETTAQVTMIAPPANLGYLFRGWSDGAGNTFLVGQIVRVAGNTTFTPVWEELEKAEDGSVTLNISNDMLFGSLSSAIAGGNSCVYDEENNVVTDGFWDGSKQRTIYTLQRNVKEDGFDTVKLTSNMHSVYGNGLSISLPMINMAISDTPYISLTYKYEAVAGKNSHVGQNMSLAITTSGGKTFYVYSDETIVSGEWRTMVFQLEDAKTSATAAYDVSAVADETIASMKLYWYPNWTGGSAKEYTGSTYYFADMKFSSVDPVYDASFISDGETAYDTVSTKLDVTMPEALTKAGYNFMGWSDGTTTYQPGDTVYISKDTTFTAVWEEYKMTFMDGLAEYTTIYTTGTFEAPECTTEKLNNTFVGWTNDGGTTVYTAGDTITVTGDTTFEAIWEGNFTITFVDAEGATVETLEKTTTFIVPTLDVTLDGYVLTGWSSDDGATVYTAGEEVTVAADTTFAPVWAKIHTVTFLDADGNTYDSGTTTDEYTLPAGPARPGYSFTAWSDGNNTYEAGTTLTIVGDTTFTAEYVYQPTNATVYNLSNDILNGSLSGVIAGGNSLVYDEENNVVTDGFWDGSKQRTKYTLARDVQMDGLDTLKLTADITSTYGNGLSIKLPAINRTIGDTPYIALTYKYEVGGRQYHIGLNMSLAITTSGGTTFYVASDETIVKDEWQALNFALANAKVYDKSSKTYVAYDASVHADETIASMNLYWYPVWSGGSSKETLGSTYYFATMSFCDNPAVFKVNYEVDGEAAYEESTVNSFTVMPEGKTVDGYNFKGWTDGTNTYQPGEMVFLPHDTTFEAVLEPYSVYFVDGSDTLVTIPSTGTLTAPECPISKVNNTFGGWTDGTNVYQTGDTITVTGDTTLEAVWVGSFTATFVDGDATVGTIEKTTTFFAPDYSLTKGGYVFGGWTSDNGETVYAIDDEITVEADTTFTAVWIKLHTVTVVDGETEVETGTTTDEYTLPAALTKDHYTFVGWNDGTTTYEAGATVTVTADTTFVAVWKTAQYTVIFKNGETTVYTTIVTVADSITVPAAYVKEGYVFKGWSDGTTTFAASSTLSVVGDTTFEAEFVTVAENDAKIDKNLSSDIAPATLTTDNLPWGNVTYNEETNSVTAAHTLGRYTYTISHEVKDEVNTIKLVNDKFSATGNENASIYFSVPFDITVAEAKLISLDYCYSTIHATHNQNGKKMSLILYTESGKSIFVHSNETFVNDKEWHTFTFDLANAKVGDSSKWTDFDYTTVLDEKITSIKIRWFEASGRTDAGGFKAKAGDTIWYSNMSFAQIGDVGAYTATLMNGEDKYAAAETNGTILLPEAPEGALGWTVGDDTTTYAAGATVSITEDTTITAKYLTFNYGHSVTFENNLSLNYYIPEAQLSGYDSFYLVVKKGDELVTITDHDLTVNGYKFVFEGISACEAGVELEATLHADLNGESYASNADTYSVKEYAYNKLAESTKPAFKTLLVDMLNYCAAAQLYFGVDTENLVNAELTNEQKALATQTDADVSGATGTNDTTGIIWGKSVVFNSNVELKFYMDLSAYDDITLVTVKLEYTANGVATVKTVDYNDFAYNSQYDAYTVKMVDIAAADLRDEVKVTVLYDGEEVSDTVSYNVAAYVNSRLTNSTNESFKTLLKELMKYSDSAKTYFNK